MKNQKPIVRIKVFTSTAELESEKNPSNGPK
jgi:hypothetical protein